MRTWDGGGGGTKRGHGSSPSLYGKGALSGSLLRLNHGSMGPSLTPQE